MTLKDVMSSGVYAVNPNASIHDAAELMKKANVGMLPVIDNHKVVGVVTDRDLVTRCLARDYPRDYPRDATVRVAMTTEPLQLSESTDLDKALEIMANCKVGRLLVHDSNGKLTGVFTATDAAASCYGHRAVMKLMATLKQAHHSKEKNPLLTSN